MVPYEHFAQYYETDQMGIVHHSNFIRWLEEARVYFMDQIGSGYDRMEQEGVFSPVVEVCCQYKKMVHFHECVQITVRVKKYNGVRLYLDYEIIEKDGQSVCATASSTHCFVDRQGQVVMLKKICPKMDEKLKGLL